MWLTLTLAFACWLYVVVAWEASLLFVTIFLLEEFLSADNLFVFYLIFAHFALSPRHRQRVLLHGIVASVVVRLTILSVGIGLLERLAFLLPLCGIALVVTGGKMAWDEIGVPVWCGGRGDGGDDDGDDDDDEDEDGAEEASAVTRCMHGSVGRCLHLTDENDDRGSYCLLTGGGGGGSSDDGDDDNGDDGARLRALRRRVRGWLRYSATPACLALCSVVVSNVVFSLDSIPAVLSISTNVPLLFTAELLSLMSMRSLYTVIASLNEMFAYVQHALAFILVFIGGKLLVAAATGVELSPVIVLLVVMSAFAVAIAASVCFAKSSSSSSSSSSSTTMPRQPKRLGLRSDAADDDDSDDGGLDADDLSNRRAERQGLLSVNSGTRSQTSSSSLV
jgi:tellurite resistance protein TerC